MTLITDLTSRPTTDGTEEFVVNVGTTDYKVTGAAIVAGVVTTHAAYVTSNNAAVAVLTAGKLNLAGGTMTGDIVLAGAPTSGLHPTTKTYVDNALAAKADASGATLGSTATATTAADTVESTVLATTAYVASKLEYDLLKKTTVNTATKVLAYSDRGTINVTRTTAGTCTITLPAISSLTAIDRGEFYIVDAGNNAETYNIIINRAGSDTFLGGGTTMSITTDGSSVLLYASGTTWIPKDKVVGGSITVSGANRLATNAEALALANATAVITPSELGNVLDQEIYNASVISGATKALAEADSKVWYVTRTSAGTCAITLPNPSSLSDASRFAPEIWDVATAGTNAITITPSGGTIDGAASASINLDKAGFKIINDGTNYFTVNNTQRASENRLSTSPTIGIGYATGAGGNVTQATNRTTGVTLGKVTGQITTHNASLAAGAAATFTVTNDYIDAEDVVILTIASGVTSVQTNARVTAVSAGNFNITIENNHASSAETGAILMNFAIIKAVRG